MPTARKLQTNFSKGELSPKIEGRPDLSAFFEGARTIEGFQLMRQGGLTRCPGTRYVAEVKDSSRDTILLPFEFNVDTAYILEIGHLYLRMFKQKAPVLDAGLPVELVTPYTDAEIRSLHITQSADVLYLWHPDHPSHKLSRVSDTDWTLSIIQYDPPPTFAADTVLRNLIPPYTFRLAYSATTGTGIKVRVGDESLDAVPDSPCFLAADVGRDVIIGAGRARLTSMVDAYVMVADVVDAFDGDPITSGPGVLSSVGTAITTTLAHGVTAGEFISLASGAQTHEIQKVIATPTPTTMTVESAFSLDQNGIDWKRHIPTAEGIWALRLSPQTALNIEKREPEGTVTTCKTAIDAFRAQDVGKYIVAFGGLLLIRSVVSAKEIIAEIIRLLSDMTANPPDGSGTVNGAGTTLTFSASPGVQVGDRIEITSGANRGISRLVVAVPTASTTTMDSAYPDSSFTGENWRKHAGVASGAWSLEEVAWSATRGYPRTGEFYQGRLGQAGNANQPNSFWLSGSDDFERYALGSKANDALSYTIRSRQLNRIEWMADAGDLFLGTSGAEIQVVGEHNGEPLGGDILPLVRRVGNQGSAPIQPIVLDDGIFFVDRSRTKFFLLAYDLNKDKQQPTELTVFADHITAGGLRDGPLAKTTRFDPRIHAARTDGVGLLYTFYPAEKVVGFTRRITDGAFTCFAVIPGSSSTSDQVWTIAQRTINGQSKRYVEVFEENASEMAGRAWTAFYTDCAKAYSGAAVTTITGAGHLEGETVDVVADGSYIGQKVVSGGQFTLDEAASQVEYGLPMPTATIVTMRPAIEGAMIEGLPRKWNTLSVRLTDTRGGKVNGEWLSYTPNDLNEVGLFTGDRLVVGQGWDRDGYVTITQPQPYPMTLLAVYGELQVGDRA